MDADSYYSIMVFRYCKHIISFDAETTSGVRRMKKLKHSSMYNVGG